MKYLKFTVILMGLLIFFGTSAIIYIVFDRLFSKQTFIFPQKDELRKLQINENSEIINSNISDDKLILTIISTFTFRTKKTPVFRPWRKQLQI